MFSNRVMRQAGSPVSNSSRAEPSEKAALSYRKRRDVRPRLRIARKYRQERRFERAVAMAAPSTSFPRGRSTNMNRGSSAMFRTPPKMVPQLDWAERPSARTRWANRAESAVGTPPRATVTARYRAARAWTAGSAAPNRSAKASRKSQHSTPYRRAPSRQPRRAWAAILPQRARSRRPSAREKAAPPPTPNRLAMASRNMRAGMQTVTAVTLASLSVSPTKKVSAILYRTRMICPTTAGKASLTTAA